MDMEKYSKPEESVAPNTVDTVIKKLTILEDLNERSSIYTVRNSSGNVPRHKKLVQPNINRKFQSTISKSESFENIKKAQAVNNHLRRHFIRSFSKANILNKRPKWWEICNSKKSATKHSERYPYGSILILQHHQLKEKKIVNIDIGRLWHKNKGPLKSLILKEICDQQVEIETSSTYSKTRQTIGYCANKHNRVPLENEKEDYLVSNIVDIFKKLDLTEKKTETIYSATSLDNTCNAKELIRQVHCSSQDNLQNFCTNVVDVDNGNVRRSEGEQLVKSEKRSVQWNAEVDVIYYAEDTDGGAILRRQREPLRKEADQQARHKEFVQLALNKNMILFMNFYKPRKGKLF